MQLSKLLFMCLPLAVPSGAPTNVSVEVLSSNSIFITWQPPEPSQQNGVINGYTIRLTALQDGSNHVYNLSGTVLLQSHLIEGAHAVIFTGGLQTRNSHELPLGMILQAYQDTVNSM